MLWSEEERCNRLRCPGSKPGIGCSRASPIVSESIAHIDNGGLLFFRKNPLLQFVILRVKLPKGLHTKRCKNAIPQWVRCAWVARWLTPVDGLRITPR